MKESTVIISSQSPSEDAAVIKMLINAGFSHTYGTTFERGYVTVSSRYEEIATDINCRAADCNVYFSRDLTPEICQSFPGAKQLPPQGPWEFEGRMWEIDGDEERLPKDGEVYSHKGRDAFRATFGYTNDKCWILRPIITAELQAAMNHQRQTAKVVNEARKANREAMDKVADLRTSTP